MSTNVTNIFEIFNYVFGLLRNAFSHQDFGTHSYFAGLFCIYIAVFIFVSILKLLKKGYI